LLGFVITKFIICMKKPPDSILSSTVPVILILC
jgi:hypothetical protein